MTAVCCSLLQFLGFGDWSRLEWNAVGRGEKCSGLRPRLRRADSRRAARDGRGEWMMIAPYRSVPVREGKGRSGTGRYYVVIGGTKWYQAVRRRRGSVEVLKR